MNSSTKTLITILAGNPGNMGYGLGLSDIPQYCLCSEEKLLPLLNALDVKKSTGADGISALMLKKTAYSIVPSLSKVFNLSIRSGKVPRDWKFARVVPIPKSGDRENPTNYRPISVISKILESLIVGIIIDSKGKGYVGIGNTLLHTSHSYLRGLSLDSEVLNEAKSGLGPCRRTRLK